MCWCTELLKSTRLVNLTSPERPASCALPFWKALSKQLSSIKVKNGSCLCLPFFSYFKLSSHCWSSAGKGHECQLIHSDKRLSCMSPGQSNDCWHPCPTYVILCIIFNPEFTSTTQRRKLRELRWGGSLVHTHTKSPDEVCLQQ